MKRRVMLHIPYNFRNCTGALHSLRLFIPVVNLHLRGHPRGYYLFRCPSILVESLSVVREFAWKFQYQRGTKCNKDSSILEHTESDNKHWTSRRSALQDESQFASTAECVASQQHVFSGQQPTLPFSLVLVGHRRLLEGYEKTIKLGIAQSEPFTSPTHVSCNKLSRSAKVPRRFPSSLLEGISDATSDCYPTKVWSGPRT